MTPQETKIGKELSKKGFDVVEIVDDMSKWMCGGVIGSEMTLSEVTKEVNEQITSEIPELGEVSNNEILEFVKTSIYFNEIPSERLK